MVLSNRELLNELFDRGRVNTRPGTIFETTPSHLTEGFDFRRIQGMLLGLAIGDSLGVTTESINPGRRHARFGEITDYLPNRYAHNQRVGLPSDDTQLAFWTIEQLLLDETINPENVARRFTKQRIFGLGKTVREFLKKRKRECPGTKAGRGQQEMGH
jgi:ADP-ribosyl-[dinitrogen reductase] hydrolase